MELTEASFKVVIVGNGCVGKTCLIHSIVNKTFPTEYIPTVFDDSMVVLPIKEKKYALRLFDTAGQDEYDRLRPLSYPNTDAFLITYAVDNPASFKAVKDRWKHEVDDKQALIWLVGLKIDLRRDRQKSCLKFEEGRKLAQKLKLDRYFECNSLTFEGVEELFTELTIALTEKAKKRQKELLQIIEIEATRCSSGGKKSKSKKPIAEIVTSENVTPKEAKLLFSSIIADLKEGNATDVESNLTGIFKIMLEFHQYLNPNDISRLTKKFPLELVDHLMKNPNEVLDIISEPFLEKVLKDLRASNLDDDQIICTLVSQMKNDRNENMLHRLALSNFQLIDLLAEWLGYDVIGHLMLARNNANNSPFMISISNKDKTLTARAWSICHFLFASDRNAIQNLKLSLPNQYKKNILHLLGELDDPALLSTVCESVDIGEIVEALNVERSPLLSIKDENCLKDLLIKIGWLERLSDSAKIDLLHNACRRNLNSLVKRFMNAMPSDEFRDMLKEREKDGNNCLMLAAQANSDLVLMSLVTFVFYEPVPGDDSSDNLKHVTFPANAIDDFLHSKNENGHTLLKIVISQGERLHIARDLLLKIESDYHRMEGIKSLATCLKGYVGPHKAVAKAIQMEREYLSDKSSSRVKIKIKSWLIALIGLIFPLGIFVQDVVTDSLLTKEYYHEWQYKSNLRSSCESISSCSPNQTAVKKLCDIPLKLSSKACFLYSFSFLVAPIACYVVEWNMLESPKFNKKLSKFLREIQSRGSGAITCTMKICLLVCYHIMLIFLWPVMSLFSKFWLTGKYGSAFGEQRFNLHQALEEKADTTTRATMIEVCIESTFQPILQVYLYLPKMIADFQCRVEPMNWRHLVTNYSIENLQLLAILTSIISLGFSFTKYEATMKKGTLTLSKKILLMTSAIMQIFGRITLMVLFTYTYGPGNFWPIMNFLLVHSLIMLIGFIVICYSNGYELNLELTWNGLFNGVANIYLHNWINRKETDSRVPKRKSISSSFTIERELLVEGTIIIENIFFLAFVLVHFQKNEIICFIAISAIIVHFVGVLLKLIYFYFCHLWRDILCPINVNWLSAIDDK